MNDKVPEDSQEKTTLFGWADVGESLLRGCGFAALIILGIGFILFATCFYMINSARF